MTTTWKFEDAPNAASITTVYVLEGSPILRVYHDYEGGWQFHGAADQPTTTEVARIVSLKSMVDRDVTLLALHDLPFGWRAERESPGDSWSRAKNHPFATHEQNGYYLEDADWMAEYFKDINPPSNEVRNSLPIGAYAKLLFRFAGELADRQDYENERMWVSVVEIDENEYYIGKLENDPHHGGILRCGDLIHFHPTHVMEISVDDD